MSLNVPFKIRIMVSSAKPMNEKRSMGGNGRVCPNEKMLDLRRNGC